MATEQGWYFDPTTGAVAQGKAMAWNNRMGPYDSREEAEHALKTARERTAAADAAEAAEAAEEDNWGEPASWER